MKPGLHKAVHVACNPFTIVQIPMHSRSILGRIELFLERVSNISIGYREIIFFKAEELLKGQVGYSISKNGKSLITGKVGDWKSKWIAIACDDAGDPIIVDTIGNKDLILSAAHGEGVWEPYVIADSIDAFKEILSIISDLSVGRSSPTEMAANPIRQNESMAAKRRIKRVSPGAEMWYWETFLED